jgi:hypothetical protein
MAFSFVQAGQTYTTGSASSWAVISPGNATAGNLLFANIILHVTAGQTISGISDTQGNTWTPCETAQSVTYSANSYLIQSWYAVAKTTGANTVTVTGSAAATFSGLSVAEYAPGGSGTWTLDQVATSVESATLHQLNGVAISTLQTATMVIGMLFDGNSSGYGSSGSYTLRTPTTSTAAALVDNLNVGAGTYTPICALSSQAAGSNNQAASTHNFYLAPSTSSISGNAGVAGATVAWSGTSSGSTTADGSGNYTISGLSNGSYVITPSLVNYTFSPTSQNETVSGSNITGVNFTATANPSVYSVPDCRDYATFPNSGVTTNGTVQYTGQTSSNHAIPPTDSRTSKPQASGTYPQNSRTQPPFPGN